MRMNRFCFFLLSTMLVLGCAPTVNLDSWVSEKYVESFPPPPPAKSYITFKVIDTAAANDSKASITKEKEKTKSSTGITSKWHYYNVCAINPVIPLTSFSKTVLFYAPRKKLKEKLNGKTIELTLATIPHHFSFINNGSKFFGVGSEELYIKPEKKSLIISYRVLDGSTEVKTGVITIPNVDKVVDQPLSEPTKVATKNYLDQYDASITAMSKTFLDKLVAEL